MEPNLVYRKTASPKASWCATCFGLAHKNLQALVEVPLTEGTTPGDHQRQGQHR
jgi:hypothetical protein